MKEGTKNLLQSACYQIRDLCLCPDGKAIKNGHGIQLRSVRLGEQSPVILEVMCVLAEDFVSVSDCEHGEVADGSTEGSVYDASIKCDWRWRRRGSEMLLYVRSGRGGQAL